MLWASLPRAVLLDIYPGLDWLTCGMGVYSALRETAKQFSAWTTITHSASHVCDFPLLHILVSAWCHLVILWHIRGYSWDHWNWGASFSSPHLQHKDNPFPEFRSIIHYLFCENWQVLQNQFPCRCAIQIFCFLCLSVSPHHLNVQSSLFKFVSACLCVCMCVCLDSTLCSFFNQISQKDYPMRSDI